MSAKSPLQDTVSEAQLGPGGKGPIRLSRGYAKLPSQFSFSCPRVRDTDARSSCQSKKKASQQSAHTSPGRSGSRMWQPTLRTSGSYYHADILNRKAAKGSGAGN